MINLVLREIAQNGQITEYTLDTLRTIQVSPGSSYTLIDQASGQPVEGLTLARHGDHLQIQLDGELIATLNGFYVDGANISFSEGSSLLASSADIEGEAVWEVAAQASISAADAGLAALVVGGLVLAADLGDDYQAPKTLTIDAAAGPFITSMGVEIYGSDGTLLAELQHDFSTGPVAVDFNGSYSGPLLIKVIDINGDGVDYLDETTGENVSLGSQTLRAMASTDDSEISVTPLTELAVRLAGISDDNTVSEEQVAMNDQVAELFGLTDILGDITTVVDDDFDSTDGVDAAEGYGQVLAVLSGADTVSGGIDETLDAIVDALVETTDGSLDFGDAALLLNQGFDAFAAGENGDAISEETVNEVIPGVDVIAPTMVSATVTAAGLVEIHFDENLADTINPADFSITVNGQTYLFTTATLSAAVITLTPAENIYSSDTVGTVEYLAENNSVVDLAGNIAVAATLDRVTNNSAGLVLSIDKAYSTLTDLTVNQTGADGNDLMSISLYQSESTDNQSNRLYDLEIEQIGQGGNDAMTLNLNALAPAVETFTSIASEGAGTEIYTNTSAYAGVVSNDLTLAGGAGADSLAVNILATANAAPIEGTGTAATIKGEATVEIAYNEILLNGGTGSDAMTVFMSANAVGLSTDAHMGFAGNHISALGADGIDAIDIDIIAHAEASGNSASEILQIGAAAGIGYNYLSVSAETIDIDLIANATASYYIEASVSENDLLVNVAGSAHINLEANAYGAVNSKYAAVRSNSVDIYAGSGADLLSVDMLASIEGTKGAAYAEIRENEILIDALAGDDQIQVDAQAIAMVTGTEAGPVSALIGTSEGSNIDSLIDIYAGEGTDSIEINLLATANGAARGAEAHIGAQHIVATAEQISANLVANATGTSASARVSNNSIDFAVDSAAALNISALATGQDDAYANIGDNDLSLYGGSDADSLSIHLQAHAQAGSADFSGFASADARIANNSVALNGGAGNDNLSLNISALATASATESSSAAGILTSNAFLYRGGEGADSLSLNVDADRFRNNLVLLRGGEGADTIHIDIDLNLSTPDAYYGNYYSAYYSALDQIGDSFNGLAAGSNNDLAFNFYSTAFNGANSEGGRLGEDQFVSGATVVAADADDYYLYDTDDRVLYYDADGNGAGAAVVVANFDSAFSGLNASNIAIGGNVDLDISSPSSGADLRISQIGGDKVDRLSARIYDQASTSNATVVFADLIQAGFAGDDHLVADLSASIGGSETNYGYINSNLINQQGSEGDDALSASLRVLAESTSGLEFTLVANSNDIEQAGSSGDDSLSAAISALADISQTGTTAANIQARVEANNAYQYGGEGVDQLNANIRAQAFGLATTANAQLSENRLDQEGGSGADLLNATVAAEASSASALDALVSDNVVRLLGNRGADSLSTHMLASALNGAEASARIDSNRVNLNDGQLLNADISALAIADQSASANIENNSIGLRIGSEGSSSASLHLDILASAQASDASADAYVKSNWINVDGSTGSDMLSVHMSAIAGDLSSGLNSANAGLSANYLFMYAESGNDSLVLDLAVQATAVNNANAAIDDNRIFMNAGEGADTLSVILSAYATAVTASAYIQSNNILLSGDDGADTMNLDIKAGIFQNNDVFVRGGEGADTFNLLGTGTSSSSNNLDFFYAGTDEFGDSINGVNGGANFLFASYNFEFSTSEGHLLSSQFDAGSTATVSIDSDDYFFYDTINFVLYYDADGSGSADAMAVASFDANLGIVYSDIQFGSSEF